MKTSKHSIQEYTLISTTGMELKVINFGGTITSLKIPIDGQLIDVVLGFDSVDDYLASFYLENPPYFGAVVGRFSGRIRDAKFKINGSEYSLKPNYGNHQIHGGSEGLSLRFWDVVSVLQGEEPSITFLAKSPHLEGGFPGEVDIELTYKLTKESELEVTYKATSTKDTILNLTQHSYFNLDGHTGNVLNQKLQINAEKVLETGEANVPTGMLIPLSNHAFDFSKPKFVPDQIDDAFVLKGDDKLAAELFSSKYNLQMKVFTNQPCVQVYVGGEVDSKLNTKEKSKYHTTSGICFETQAFPDAPNHEDFPSCVLRKGDVYNHHTIFKFTHFLG